MITQREASVLNALRGCALVGSLAPGVLRVRGNDRIDLLHRLSTNDLSRMKPGEVLSTVLTTEKGRIVDAVTVGTLEDSAFLFCSRGREEAVFNWLDRFVITDDFNCTALRAEHIVYNIIGPSAVSMASTLLDVMFLPDRIVEYPPGNGTGFAVTSSGPLGDAVRIFFDQGSEDPIGSMLRRPAGGPGLPELDEHGAEFFRIVAGVPGPAGELTGEHTPYDVGLESLISFRKGCYVGQEVIARLDTYQKGRKALAGVWCGESGSADAGSGLFSGEELVGTLTSVSPVIVAGRRPGLAVMRRESVRTGSEYADAGGKTWTVANLPQRLWAS